MPPFGLRTGAVTDPSTAVPDAGHPAGAAGGSTTPPCLWGHAQHKAAALSIGPGGGGRS